MPGPARRFLSSKMMAPIFLGALDKCGLCPHFWGFVPNGGFGALAFICQLPHLPVPITAVVKR